MADFFETPSTQQVEPEQQPELIKLGDKEYTQEELSRKVGLGEMAEELESKWNTRIDRLYPEYTRATQEREALKSELEAARRPVTPEQVDEQEALLRAKETLAKMGYVPAEEVKQIVRDQVQGMELLRETQGFLNRMADEGNPNAKVEDLLRHMEETGIRTPEKAYKDMFETELDAIKERKLAALKAPGLVTETSSTAGSKEPAPQKVTSDNLAAQLESALRGR